jgi:DNA-binding NtrC family response regulator
MFNTPLRHTATTCSLDSSAGSGLDDFRARRQPVILLIDDDPAVLKSLARVFASEGMTAVTAANGAEAIQCLGDCLPDLIVTDLCMAGINGWDVLFHERLERPGLPIFVITGLAATDTGGADRFASAFFQKPLDIDALVAAVRRHLEVGESIPAAQSSY